VIIGQQHILHISTHSKRSQVRYDYYTTTRTRRLWNVYDTRRLRLLRVRYECRAILVRWNGRV